VYRRIGVKELNCYFVTLAVEQQGFHALSQQELTLPRSAHNLFGCYCRHRGSFFPPRRVHQYSHAGFISVVRPSVAETALLPRTTTAHRPASRRRHRATYSAASRAV